MKKTLLYLLLSVCAMGVMQQANAQTCDGQRYYSQIFSSYDTSTVIYTDPSVTSQNMDIYQATGDTGTNRRAIIMIHGGSFYAGTRQDPFEVAMCQYFTMKGYVCVSIDYRLIPLVDITSLGDSTTAFPYVAQSISDAKAAMRYLKKNAASLKIDTSWIVIGGESAGAIIADHMAYLTSLSQATPLLLSAFNTVGGTIEGNSGNPGYTSFGAKAVLNNAGAMLYLGFLNTSGVTTPIYQAQGDSDGTVPYDCGQVLEGASNIQMCGTYAMEPVLNTLGIKNYWHTFDYGGHCPWDTSAAELDSVESETALFLYQLDCPNFVSGIKDISASRVSLYPNPASGQIKVQTDADMETITIIDAMGRVVSTASATGTQTEVDISPLSTGIYVAKISFKGEQGSAVRTFAVE